MPMASWRNHQKLPTTADVQRTNQMSLVRDELREAAKRVWSRTCPAIRTANHKVGSCDVSHHV